MRTLLKSAAMATVAVGVVTGVSGFSFTAQAADKQAGSDVLQLALADTTDEATILSWADEPAATAPEEDAATSDTEE